jgi:hypothetical protein
MTGKEIFMLDNGVIDRVPALAQLMEFMAKNNLSAQQLAMIQANIENLNRWALRIESK